MPFYIFILLNFQILSSQLLLHDGVSLYSDFMGPLWIQTANGPWLSNLSALVKCAADQKIESHKKEKNRYRYQANKAYIIGRRKMFIARLGSLQVPAVFPYWTIYLKVRVLTDRRFIPADASPEKRKQTPATGSTLIIASSFYKYLAPSQLILSNSSSCLNSWQLIHHV